MKHKYFLFGMLLLTATHLLAQRAIYIPELLGDGWQSDTITSVGADLSVLIPLLDSTANMYPNDLRSIILVKNNKLVDEEYYNSWWRTNVLDIRSAGKSITSLLAWIALDQGLISLDDSLLSFFPEYKDLQHVSPQKERITVRHLLSMSSGLDADAYDSQSPGNENYMLPEKDWVRFALDLPMSFEPVERYAYNSAAALLLGAVIEQASGEKLVQFAQQHLFDPLNIKHYYWSETPTGRNIGQGNLYMIARDMAKIGQLMLAKGKWNGQRIVGEKWIKMALLPHFDISDEDPYAQAYGWMWYLAEMQINGDQVSYYFASGNGGNKIYVVPQLDLVLIVAQTAYGQGYGHRRAEYILMQVLEAFL